MKRVFNLVIVMLLSTVALASAKPAQIVTSNVNYKTIDTLELKLKVIAKSGYEKADIATPVIFFHGGNWATGTCLAFEKYAEYLATQGLTCFLAEYRLKNKNKTTPREALMDAKSAIRFVRSNATKFNIDAKKLIVAGGSAGGQLAAATSMCPAINDPKDDLAVSTVAKALVLFNPLISNGPDDLKTSGYGSVKGYWEDFSPMHNVRKGVPHTLYIVGEEDTVAPPALGQEYKKLVEKSKGQCELIINKGLAHCLYRTKNIDENFFLTTLEQMHNYLQKKGYIKNDSQVEEWAAVAYPSK